MKLLRTKSLKTKLFWYLLLVITIASFLFTGCLNQNESLSGGILVSFDVLGERYKVFITNESTIKEVLAVQRGESQAKIPSGLILEGTVWYNEPWSWHIDSEDIHMAELTVEACSGLPSHVENNLDYWINTVGRFCPWSAEIVDIKDYR